MKKLTIVVYMAYDMMHLDVFENKTDAEVKASLSVMCSTYVITNVRYAEVMSEYSGMFKIDTEKSQNVTTEVAQVPGYLTAFQKKED